MQNTGPGVQRFVNGFNAWMVRRRSSPRWGRFVARYITMVTYTGRRSGRTFRTPVGYRRVADGVTIPVRIPDSKTWWRNFTGDGGPIALELDGTDRTGHAVVRRNDKGLVTVAVRLDA